MRLVPIIALVLLLAIPTTAQQHVKDVGGPFFHVFHLADGAGSKIYKIIDFDIDGDGTADCNRITRIGWRNGSTGSPDTVSIHLNTAYSEFLLINASVDQIPVLGRKFSEIVKAYTDPDKEHTAALTGTNPDSAVFRWGQATTTTDTYIYVWGE